MDNARLRSEDGRVASNLLASVCHVTHGVPPERFGSTSARLPRQDFFDALVRHQRTLQRAGRPSVSRQAIRLWERGSVPQRQPAVDFLIGFLQATRPNWDVGDPRFEDRKRLGTNLLLAGERRVPTRPLAEGRPRKLGALDPYVALAMQGLVHTSRSSRQSEHQALFRGSRPGNDVDSSYFLLYRYSTNGGKVLKSFLVVRKPFRASDGVYTFNHFIWGGRETDDICGVFRECEGFILKLPKSFYFIGYNFTVPVDKRRSNQLYKQARPDARWSPSGLGAIAFEYDDIATGPGLFGGVTLTVAALAQPVVSRVAMLHLGTRQSFGRDIADTLVEPGEIDPGDVAHDLGTTLASLTDAGCSALAPALEATRRDHAISEVMVRRMSRRVLAMIDNTPAWRGEAGRSARRSSKGDGEQGAIETFGNGRPRD